MKTYLYLLSIGPVQAFIAQARKTQDLYESSSLLSWLCRKGIQRVKEKYKERAQCIFPGKPEAASIPNRFLIRLESDETPKQLKKFGETVARYIQEKAYMEEKGLSRLSKFYGGPEGKNMKEQLRYLEEGNIKSQLQYLLDIRWVIVPVEKGYESAYEKAQQMLGVAKNAVTFHQTEETGRKCSVCGLRNVRFYRCSPGETRVIFKEKDKDALSRLRESKLFHERGIAGEAAIYHSWDSGVGLGLSDLQPGEGLCAVCAAKRFNMGGDFPSTAQVALMDSRERWLRQGAVVEDADYMDCFSIPGRSLAETFNWQFFYEENISSIQAIEKSGFQLGKHKHYSKKRRHFQQIQNKHLQLSQRLRELGVPLRKYYSLVSFDGDLMGEWFLGKNTPGVEPETFHLAFSQALSEYGEWVVCNLREPQGKVIYAGGDDFLGLANLQHLYTVLNKLREAFGNQVNQRIQEKFAGQLKAGASLTFSAGVIIAHYKTPLQEVLQQARRLQGIAKEKGGRNALAIGLLQRTGSLRYTYWPWYYNGKKTIGLLQQANELLRPDKLSGTFARELIRFLQPLLGKEGTLPFETTWKHRTGYLEMVKTELQRLISRATAPSLEKEEEEQIAAFASELFALLDSPDTSAALIGKAEDSSGKVWRIQNFLHLLELILFMSSHTILEKEKTATA